MTKNLEEIRDEFENEIDTAQGLSEIMLLIHTGTYGFEKNGITFQSVSRAFSLIAKLFDEHVRNLDMLANELIDLQNEIKVK